eukprot:g180.t1
MSGTDHASSSIHLSEHLVEQLNEDSSEDLSEDLNEQVNEGLSESFNEPLNKELSKGLSEPLNRPLNEFLSEELNEDLNESLNEDVNDSFNKFPGHSLGEESDFSESIGKSRLNDSYDSTADKYNYDHEEDSHYNKVSPSHLSEKETVDDEDDQFLSSSLLHHENGGEEHRYEDDYEYNRKTKPVEKFEEIPSDQVEVQFQSPVIDSEEEKADELLKISTNIDYMVTDDLNYLSFNKNKNSLNSNNSNSIVYTRRLTEEQEKRVSTFFEYNKIPNLGDKIPSKIFKKVIAQAGIEGHDETEVEQMVRIANLVNDENGAISLETCLHLLQNEMSVSMLHRLFARTNTDVTNERVQFHLDMNEMEKLFEKIGLKIKKSEIEKKIRLLDRDIDGNVDWEEFLTVSSLMLGKTICVETKNDVKTSARRLAKQHLKQLSRTLQYIHDLRDQIFEKKNEIKKKIEDTAIENVREKLKSSWKEKDDLELSVLRLKQIHFDEIKDKLIAYDREKRKALETHRKYIQKRDEKRNLIFEMRRSFENEFKKLTNFKDFALHVKDIKSKSNDAIQTLDKGIEVGKKLQKMWKASSKLQNVPKFTEAHDATLFVTKQSRVIDEIKTKLVMMQKERDKYEVMIEDELTKNKEKRIECVNLNMKITQRETNLLSLVTKGKDAEIQSNTLKKELQLKKKASESKKVKAMENIVYQFQCEWEDVQKQLQQTRSKLATVDDELERAKEKTSQLHIEMGELKITLEGIQQIGQMERSVTTLAAVDFPSLGVGIEGSGILVKELPNDGVDSFKAEPRRQAPKGNRVFNGEDQMDSFRQKFPLEYSVLLKETSLLLKETSAVLKDIQLCYDWEYILSIHSSRHPPQTLRLVGIQQLPSFFDREKNISPKVFECFFEWLHVLNSASRGHLSSEICLNTSTVEVLIPHKSRYDRLNGPLSELQFWNDRLQVLQNLDSQCGSDQVRSVIAFLLDIDGFNELTDAWSTAVNSLHRASRVALWNCKYLRVLKNPLTIISSIRQSSSLAPVQCVVPSLVKTLYKLAKHGSNSNTAEPPPLPSHLTSKSTLTSSRKKHPPRGYGVPSQLEPFLSRISLALVARISFHIDPSTMIRNFGAKESWEKTDDATTLLIRWKDSCNRSCLGCDDSWSSLSWKKILKPIEEALTRLKEVRSVMSALRRVEETNEKKFNSSDIESLIEKLKKACEVNANIPQDINEVIDKERAKARSHLRLPTRKGGKKEKTENMELLDIFDEKNCNAWKKIVEDIQYQFRKDDVKGSCRIFQRIEKARNYK